jgi:hypothetical protein
VTVVRESSSEGRAVVEGVYRAVLGQFHLLLEGVDLVPEVQHVQLFLGEVGAVGHYYTYTLRGEAHLPVANFEFM